MDLDRNRKSSDEDEGSGDEERSDGRRRRFCIERKQPKRLRSETVGRHPIILSSPKGQSPPNQPVYQQIHQQQQQQHHHHHHHHHHQQHHNHHHHHHNQQQQHHHQQLDQQQQKPPPPTLAPEPSQPRGPVIFINPKFVKKFIEKTIKLAPSSSSKCMIDDIDFKTSPRESLQAASTMAIIRLVAECIEDDNKRDEKSNKTLVARLINELIGDHSSTQDETSKSNSQTNSTISEDDGGRPIPVIGGSINNHQFSSSSSSSSSNSRIKSHMCRRRALRHQ